MASVMASTLLTSTSERPSIFLRVLSSSPRRTSSAHSLRATMVGKDSLERIQSVNCPTSPTTISSALAASFARVFMLVSTTPSRSSMS